MSEFIDKVERVGVAAFMAVASFAVYKLYESPVGKCIRGQGVCHVSNPFKPQPTVINVGPFKKDSETLHDTIEVESYGHAQIVVHGQAKMDYKDALSWPGVAATYFMDPKPVTLDYTPCLKESDDYTKVKADPDSAYSGSIDISTADVPVPQPDGTTKTETHVIAKTGPIMACGMTIDQSNQNNFTIYRFYDGINGVMEKESYRRTIEYIGNNLLVDFATASSCPAQMTDQKAVQTSVAEKVRGYLYDSPKYKTLANLPIDVQIAPADQEEQHQVQIFNDQVAQFQTMKETVPDSKGHRDKIKSVVVVDKNSFVKESCTNPNIQIRMGQNK